jgi:hypothetical protein
LKNELSASIKEALGRIARFPNTTAVSLSAGPARELKSTLKRL